MSATHLERRNKNPTAVSDESHDSERIDVSNHAGLRYLQRVDPRCPNPDQQLRQLFRNGSPAPDHPAVSEGRARQAGNTIVVYRGSEAAPRIVTVLIDGRQR